MHAIRLSHKILDLARLLYLARSCVCMTMIYDNTDTVSPSVFTNSNKAFSAFPRQQHPLERRFSEWKDACVHEQRVLALVHRERERELIRRKGSSQVSDLSR